MVSSIHESGGNEGKDLERGRFAGQGRKGSLNFLNSYFFVLFGGDVCFFLWGKAFEGPLCAQEFKERLRLFGKRISQFKICPSFSFAEYISSFLLFFTSLVYLFLF